MKKHSNVIKIATQCMALLTVAMLTACAGSDANQDETVIIMKKDGSVQSNISESFEQSYYDKDELQQMILAEAAAYNRQTGNSDISVEKVEEKDGRAVVQMSYVNAMAYATYNNEIFFAGSPKEAEEAGFDLNVVLSSAKDAQDTIGKGDILNMDDVILFITDTEESVMFSGKVLYISNNVVLSEKNKKTKLQAGSDKLAYVIYKN